MIPLFTGYDVREAKGWQNFVQSLVEHSPGVGLTPLSGLQADGSNSFTYARFRIPRLMNFGGMAIYVDGSDMLLRDDIRNLAALADPSYAVQVVKHDYKTKHPRKYVGTVMESENQDYPRKNWSSVIIWNCGHIAHFRNRELLDGIDGSRLHRFDWLKASEIGDLPLEWNWLADEYGENEKAKLLHWTAGMPGFKHYAQAPMSRYWHETAKTLHSER